eukprot:gene17853-19636_t
MDLSSNPTGFSEDEKLAKAPEKINIKVIKCNSLHLLKSSHLTTNVRIEFGSTIVGESQKYEYDQDNGVTQYDYECSLSMIVADPLILDELVQTPLVVTVNEILPRDRKTREERTNILGQVCIDLIALVQGQTNVTSNYKLHSPIPSPESSMKNEADLPEIEICLSVEKPLLPDEHLSTSNLVKICIESLCSLPESWSSTTGNQFMYLLALPMPVSNQKEVSVVVPNGSYRSAGEKEQSNLRRWCMAPTASGASLFIQNSAILQTSYQEQDGDLNSKEDNEFRSEAENEKSRVTWNSERRCFLSRQAAESLMKSIAKNRVWPVEIARTIVSQGVKGKGKGEEEITTSFHGVAYVDMAPLLYPGVKKIRGAFLVKPFSESEFVDRTGRKGTLIDDAIKMITTSRSSSSNAQSKMPIGKGNKLDGKPKPSAAILKPPDSIPENETHDAKRNEGQQFTEAKTYIVIEIDLESPLVSKREPAALERRISELIPPRSKFMKKEGGEKKSIECFQNQIQELADQLLDEYREIFSSTLDKIDADEQDKRKREFLYHINASGKYFALKEQLKYFVVKIVREKYKNTSPFNDRYQLQSFLSELYEFLLSQMHLGLGNFFRTEESTEIPPVVRDEQMLKFFAFEAEVMFNYDLAAKYYQERIASGKSEPRFWVDYGCFCLHIGDNLKAEECFKESVSIDQNYIDGLIMNGCMAVMHNRHEEAEVFFETATCSKPNSAIAWTAAGLYYSSIENSIMAERAFNEAKRLCTLSTRSEIAKKGSSGANDSKQIQCFEENKEGDDSRYKKSNNKESSDSIFLECARYFLRHRVIPFAERALSCELLASNCGESAAYFQTLADLQIARKEYDKAEQSIMSCLKLEHDNPNAWCSLGHLKFLSCEEVDGKEAYERALSYEVDAQDLHTLYLRLSMMYLKEEQFLKAKKMYLEACSRRPSCISWLGAGVSSYRLEQLPEAEMALNEANILDNQNHDVWAYLTLVCTKQKRFLEAEQCYKYALKTLLVLTRAKDKFRTIQTDVFSFSNQRVPNNDN